MLVTAASSPLLSAPDTAEAQKAPVTDGAGVAVLRQCSAAYQSLRSYVGTTRLTDTTQFSDQVLTDKVEAKVHFVRAGLIRIEGVKSSEDETYFRYHFLIVSNGQEIWHASGLHLPFRLMKGKSLQEEVGSLDGTALGAAKVIPSL